MSDDEAGYCRPPKRHQFKKGICPNPLGRGRRTEHPVASALDSFLRERIPYRKGGEIKRASRVELSIERLIALALSGDVAAADNLLTLRKHASRDGAEPSAMRIIVEGGMPAGYEFERRDGDFPTE